jgi:hypothetical protein
MNRLASPFSSLALALLLSAPGHAGTLTSATWFQVARAGGGAIDVSIPMTRSFGQLGATGTSTAASVAVSLSYPAFATTVFVPGSIVSFAVQVMQGGAQAITATPGMGGGTPGIPGTLVVMSAPHAAMGVNQSMILVGNNTVLRVPLRHGEAGIFTNTFNALGAFHRITVEFYAWTPGTLVFSGLTTFGSPLPDVVAMGSFDLTANGGGAVTLVAPSKVSIDGNLVGRRSASFATLKLSFVPEPGTLLLLGGAALALALRARREERIFPASGIVIPNGRGSQPRSEDQR